VVTNSGNATLHITAVNVAGNNPADFSSSTASCSNAALTPNATCAISVVFAPLAAGQRSETITLTDDASDSPQTIQVTGNANPAVSLGASPTGSTSASVSAGGTAQYSLQLTPGAGFTGNVTFSCTGAPLGAGCQVPSLAVSGSNAMAFTVTVTTSGPAHAQVIPFPPHERTPRNLRLPFPWVLLAAILFFAWVRVWARDGNRTVRRVWMTTALTLIVLAAAAANGCGGGGGGAQLVAGPPPVITPQGTSTLTVTPSATNAAGSPLQLSPIQLTLNVN
jgi:hypothetical protein